MKINIGLVLLLIGTSAVTHLVDAQDQTGFISLDCGLVPKDHRYTETRTNITYISDTTMISVGEVKKLGPEFKAGYQQQLWSLRAFPEGIRNCYDLQNLRKGDRYLIRASFLYGNYDGRNVLPNFDIYVGPNLWFTVEISSVVDDSFLELVHVLTSNHLQVCLVKTGLTVPFISSLELRPLRNDTYIAQSGSLMKFYRWFLSSKRGFIRFEEDIHDRMWDSYFDDDWRQINTSLAINTSAKCEVPELAMKTAAVPRIDDDPLLITWTDTDKYSEYYAYLHFAEIEILKANETREFFISFNEDNSSQPYSPKNFTLESLSTKRPFTSKNGTYVLRLQRTIRSSRPPLLNAFELYKVIEFPQLETNQNDADAVKSIAAIYGMNRIDWQGDPCIPQKYLWDGISCSYNDSDSPRIISLNLSTSQLKGQIAPYIFNLTQLTTLDLSNNNLIGEVPEFLAAMKHLTYINLSRNKLNGSIPRALLEKKNEGSLNLITDCELDVCYRKPGNNSYLVPTVAAVASLAIVIVVSAFIYILRRKRSAHISASRPPSAVTMNVDIQDRESSKSSILIKDRRFTYLEIMRITNNLERVIGKGGFGLVYHGFLNDTEQVAVKMLSQSSAQGYKQFMAEVELLLRVHHRNLVSLVGYCDEGDKLALVYEFMPNGDLKTHLSGNSGKDVLSWSSRLRIAAEAAQGLDYLHNGSKPPMVHRDVKTANILLDEHFQAKLADFGLSRSFPVEGETHVSTVVAGTPGYLDPEYYLTNWLTEKSDVYSYGIVLLEIITNQRVIDNARERTHIAEWIKLMVNRGDVKNMVDPMLQGDYDTNSVWKAIELAMSCVNPSPRKRPSMPLVAMELTGCLAAEMARTQGNNPQSERGISH